MSPPRQTIILDNQTATFTNTPTAKDRASWSTPAPLANRNPPGPVDQRINVETHPWKLWSLNPTKRVFPWWRHVKSHFTEPTACLQLIQLRATELARTSASTSGKARLMEIPPIHAFHALLAEQEGSGRSSALRSWGIDLHSARRTLGLPQPSILAPHLLDGRPMRLWLHRPAADSLVNLPISGPPTLAPRGERLIGRTGRTG